MMLARVASLLVGAGLLLAPAAAFALDEDVLGGPRRDYESPQHFHAELRIAPYRPQIDSDPAFAGIEAEDRPYARHFKNGLQVLVGFQVDWQALRIPYLGTLGPGVGAHFTQANGVAFERANPEVENGTTGLQIFPLYAVAVLRVDALLRELHVPLVPYGKAGIAAALWRGFNELGTSKVPGPPAAGDKGPTTLSAEGTTWGTHFAVGLALELNFLDPQAAKNFDSGYGVNHSYLYAELTHFGLDGFGNGQSLILRDTTVTGGLSVEF